jgi:hypothetical protein
MLLRRFVDVLHSAWSRCFLALRASRAAQVQVDEEAELPALDGGLRARRRNERRAPPTEI